MWEVLGMIYLLEDDPSIRKFVIYALESIGFTAIGFAAPSEFWSAMREQKPELLLLDIMLPEEDGLSVLGKLRADPVTASLPIMMLTAKGSEYDKVIGLDSGADDYVVKPFGAMELISRVRALLRRVQPVATETVYTAGCLSVLPERHQVMVGGKATPLTLKEFELLCLLFAHRGRVLTRDQILQQIWGYSFDGESRTVDVHIKTLRSKLGEAADVIETVRGLGYKIGDAYDQKDI